MPELSAANARLKAGGLRCSISKRGRTYALVATLPTRDGTDTKQQRIALGHVDLFEAEQRAVELGSQLRAKSFTWEAWDQLQTSKEVVTIEKFREVAEALHKRRAGSETTWTKKWKPALNKLPPRGIVTEEVLLRVIRRMPEGSAGRRDQGNILAQIGKEVGLDESSLQKAARGYVVANLKPRDIPSDQQILSLLPTIKLPHWRWMAGMVATYGLRPHEVASCSITEDGNCEIQEETKTGYRISWPVPLDWVKELQLTEIHRPRQSKQTLAKVANDYLHDSGGPLPWPLYNLRHAYAVRLLTRGVPPEIGAQLMGHGLEVHSRTYLRWIKAERLSSMRDRFRI